MMDDNRRGFRTEIATLGGGCFWCLQPIFEALQGVEKVVAGYAGGSITKPSYEQVSTGQTGHAEVVQVIYRADTISFEELLAIFFSVHNPTTLNRQGADVGTQYRSIILVNDEEQQQTASRMIEELGAEKLWDDPIVTQVEPLSEFYPAEDYHQGYFDNNPYQGYCQVVIAPKVSKFRARYMAKLKNPE